MKKLLTALAALSFCLSVSGQARVTRTINDKWNFTQEGKTTVVNVPHTWNAHDVWDDEPGYYRNLCTYEKNLKITEDLEGKSVTLKFEAAYQDAKVYLNDNLVGTHKGGTTAFSFDVTPYIHSGDNRLVVLLDNKHDVTIPPLSADYNFYGGIYRDVELIFTPKTHISTTFYATEGVFVKTAAVSQKESELEIDTYLTNSEALKTNVTLRHQIFGPDGALKATVLTKAKLEPSKSNQIVSSKVKIQDCKLWDIESPNIYKVLTTLCDAKTAAPLDEVEVSFGLRTFSFDGNEGFYLNGRNVKLMGTNRHQDYEDMGYGLPDEMHVRDIMLLKEMGGNFLRIAHYPQDPIVTQICDREGIVASVEIPIVNYITAGNEEFAQNCLNMITEMVWQDFNSPSVILWTYMNEVLLRRVPKAGTPERTEYLASVTALAKRLNERVKSLDASRYTMIPCHGSVDLYAESGIIQVPDVVGWNLYNGWYGGTLDVAYKNVKKAHEATPDKALILTEYGAGVDPRLHSRNPVKFDFSHEYGIKFHKYYINLITSTPYLAGSNVWNLNDFYAEGRIDAVPHVNNKGLVGLNRVKKDVYYLYKALLSKTPFMVIGGRDCPLRGGVEGESSRVTVLANTPEVTLYLNGALVGTRKVEECSAEFDVVFKDGENILIAESGSLKDGLRIDFRAVPRDLKSFKEMNVMLGSDRYFFDNKAGAIWIPEQEYKPGSWGYVGGSSLKTPSSLRTFGTINDPIFQTWRTDIQSFKADVPDGQYYVYLYFAELVTDLQQVKQVYNVGTKEAKQVVIDRSFNVTINGTEVLKDFNMRDEFGSQRALIEKFTVTVKDGKGLSVDFTPLKGHTALNAIRVYKCY